ncbi:hypothetical protein Pcinc_029395 [Petrolisthes cinctipes]|uniref:Uncharacterized protein n=1 Tax=Petrolisthes cinctipes TaxID=88211 RepID=A0AAE1F1J7_PETCI|nr:hypothetical protein Pcinc_029395 [Petrolisthes cinctipes]
MGEREMGERRVGEREMRERRVRDRRVSVLVLVVVAASTIASPSDPYHQPTYKPVPIPYKFSYGVKDDYAGADFGQNEDSDGNTVKGSYTVQLPDGRKQTVKYVADHYNGYQANVEYYGEAQYPHQYGPAVTFKPSGGSISIPTHRSPNVHHPRQHPHCHTSHPPSHRQQRQPNPHTTHSQHHSSNFPIPNMSPVNTTDPRARLSRLKYRRVTSKRSSMFLASYSLYVLTQAYH